MIDLEEAKNFFITIMMPPDEKRLVKVDADKAMQANYLIRDFCDEDDLLRQLCKEQGELIRRLDRNHERDNMPNYEHERYLRTEISDLKRRLGGEEDRNVMAITLAVF